MRGEELATAGREAAKRLWREGVDALLPTESVRRHPSLARRIRNRAGT